MTVEAEEFKVVHKTQFAYYTFTNDLCMDIYSEIDNFKLIAQMEVKIVQCNKILIDCMDDFGQFHANDISTSKKPISPYAKFLDECILGNDAPITLWEFYPMKEADPKTGLLRDRLRTLRWVGSGANDYNCFPGNVIRYFYITE